MSVYEGLKRLYGACRPNMILWDITDPVNPRVIHDQQYPGITGWHSASMSWNGQYLYSGWEPGGGTQPAVRRPVLRWRHAPDLPDGRDEDDLRVARIRRRPGRPLGAAAGAVGSENCTIHNYNLAPYPDRPHPDRRRLPGRNYVVDYTDPTEPEQIAWSDPPCFDADPVAAGFQGPRIRARWSTHWYNSHIYASDIFEGINIWDVVGEDSRWWENANPPVPEPADDDRSAHLPSHPFEPRAQAGDEADRPRDRSRER